MAARRESARVARSYAKRDGVDVVEVWRSRLSGRWRWSRWAPNGRQVGASEQAHAARSYVIEKVQAQTSGRVTVVAAGARRKDPIDVFKPEVGR